MHECASGFRLARVLNCAFFIIVGIIGGGSFLNLHSLFKLRSGYMASNVLSAA